MLYQVIVRVKGYPDVVKTYHTRKEAEREEIKIKASMQNGTFRDTKSAEKHILSDAIDRFLGESFTQERKNLRTEQGHLAWWKETLGDYALIRLTPELIAKKRDELLSGSTFKSTQRAPSTVNRYMATLSTLLTIIVEEWGWMHESPMKRVRKLKEPQGRIRFLDDAERNRLIEACLQSKNLHLHLVVVLAISTGMRKGEIMNLKWADIDLQTGRALLHKTKNGDRRVVYLQHHALDLLRKHAERFALKGSFVFPNETDTGSSDIKEAWRRALIRAKIPNFRFHDLRHCAASYLAMNGATPSEIAEILGHRSLAMVKRYAHFSESHIQEVVANMNEAIFG